MTGCSGAVAGLVGGVVSGVINPNRPALKRRLVLMGATIMKIM
jgi:hypothetical protein